MYIHVPKLGKGCLVEGIWVAAGQRQEGEFLWYQLIHIPYTELQLLSRVIFKAQPGNPNQNFEGSQPLQNHILGQRNCYRLDVCVSPRFIC